MPTDVRVCLAGGEACDLRAACSAADWPTRECLLTPVPAWTSLASVTCCFRCCLLTWQQRLGLSHNEQHWQRQGVDFYTHQGQGGSRPRNAGLPFNVMASDLMLLPRISIGRFGHVVAIESRELDDLNETTPRALLHSARFRVPGTQHANGTLVVLNRWGFTPEVFRRIASVLPPGPVALLYGDDTSWTAADVAEIAGAFPPTRPLVRWLCDQFARARCSRVVSVGAGAAFLEARAGGGRARDGRLERARV